MTEPWIDPPTRSGSRFLLRAVRSLFYAISWLCFLGLVLIVLGPFALQAVHLDAVGFDTIGLLVIGGPALAAIGLQFLLLGAALSDSSRTRIGALCAIALGGAFLLLHQAGFV